MHSSLDTKLNVTRPYKNSSSKLRKPNKKLNSSWTKSMKKHQSETLNRRKLMINTNSEHFSKINWLTLKTERSSRTRNGLVNRRNTTRPPTLLKRPNKSSAPPLTLPSYRRMPRWARLPLLSSLTTSLTLPKNRNSPDNHGLLSSTSSLPSPPPPQSRLIRTPLSRSLTFASNFWTRLLSPEKSKEETTNTGLKSMKEPRMKSMKNSTSSTKKSPTWNRKSLPSPRESRLPPMKETNS